MQGGVDQGVLCTGGIVLTQRGVDQGYCLPCACLDDLHEISRRLPTVTRGTKWHGIVCFAHAWMTCKTSTNRATSYFVSRSEASG